MNGKFYAICLFLACLAAAMLGYSLGGLPSETKPSESARETHTDQATVEEAYLDYNDYESHVAEIINDRSRP